MEDAHYIGGCFCGDPTQDLYALFDGHNGSDAAQHSIRAFPDALKQYLSQITSEQSLENQIENSKPTETQTETQIENQIENSKPIETQIENSKPIETQIENSKSTPVTTASALRSAFTATHEAIVAEGIKSGTTATAVLFRGRRTYVAHVGDSRVALVRGGVLTCFTKDHRPTDPDEQAMVIARGGIVFRGRVGGMLAITRALGDKALGDSVSRIPDVALIPFPREAECEAPLEGDDAGDDGVVVKRVAEVEGAVQSDDTLIIACDGLWDYVE